MCTPDPSSKVSRALSGLLGVCDSIKAEAMSFLMGLLELKQLGIFDCLVEGDSSIVVSWGLGNNSGVWSLLPIIHEIRELVVGLSVVLSHISRSQN